jgi:hypothetical protein
LLDLGIHGMMILKWICEQWFVKIRCELEVTPENTQFSQLCTDVELVTFIALQLLE